MYTSYYNLIDKPFRLTADPKFMWLGKKHQEALAILKYGILENKGFLVITGDVGTGKTTLIQTLGDSLKDSNTIIAIVRDPGLETLDFFNFISRAFEINKRFNSKGIFLNHFTQFLKTAYMNKQKVLLIIDEAQRLTPDLLEEIRHLSNIEKPHTKLINIFLVGQNEFNDLLQDPKNRAIRQRVAVSYHINPLTAEETDEYIRYRLKVAGTKKTIFRPDAIDKIFLYSKGYPRMINIICDLALVTGYGAEAETISPEIIKECTENLIIPIGLGKEENKEPERVDNLYEVIRANLAKRVGPIAELLINDQISAMGEDINTITLTRTDELIDRLSTEIDDKTQRNKFIQDMRKLKKSYNLESKAGYTPASKKDITPTLPTGNGDFYAALRANLAKRVGPIAELLINDQISAMGEDMKTIPLTRTDELINRLSTEIDDKTQRNKFIQDMRKGKV